MNFNSKLAIKYPSNPVEKEVVNWRFQVFVNSTVNLHFHRKNLAIFQCTRCKNAQKWYCVCDEYILS